MVYARDVLGHYTITGPMSKAKVLAAAEDILRRKLERQGILGSPRDSAAFLRTRLGHLLHEEFHAVWLDSRHHVIAVDKLFNGTIDGASVHPREVVRYTLRHNAAAVIFSHNHPSGNPEPSSADRAITAQLRSVLELIDVRCWRGSIAPLGCICIDRDQFDLDDGVYGGFPNHLRRSPMKTDRQLQQDVIDELRWDVSVEPAHIGVEVSEGVVTLSGRVGSYAEKFAVEDAAKRVAGVKAVAVDLEVKLPGSSLRTDSDIAKAVVSALAWNVKVPKDVIQVKVDDGFITLSGKVDWEFQRQAAVSSVRYLLGVRGVNNAVTLRVHAATKDVKSKIESALQRLAHQDTKAVSVEVLDGTVTLSGTTHSYLERDTIEAAAWNAAGVQRVVDRIVVSA